MTTPDPNQPPQTRTDCPHLKFSATVDVKSDTRLVTVSVVCIMCGKPMTFADHGEQLRIQGIL